MTLESTVCSLMVSPHQETGQTRSCDVRCRKRHGQNDQKNREDQNRDLANVTLIQTPFDETPHQSLLRYFVGWRPATASDRDNSKSTCKFPVARRSF